MVDKKNWTVRLSITAYVVVYSKGLSRGCMRYAVYGTSSASATVENCYREPTHVPIISRDHFSMHPSYYSEVGPKVGWDYGHEHSVILTPRSIGQSTGTGALPENRLVGQFCLIGDHACEAKLLQISHLYEATD